MEHLESGEARRFTSIEDLSAFMAYWARRTEDRRFTSHQIGGRRLRKKTVTGTLAVAFAFLWLVLAARTASAATITVDSTASGIAATIQGNLIGTDKTGTVALPNQVGISANGQFTDTLVGCDQGREGLAATPFRRSRS